MVIPVKARKLAKIGQGDVLAVHPEGDGRILLVRLDRPDRPRPLKTRFIARKGRHTVASTGQPITTEQVKALESELL
jgi:bifunctional DNA-binding transcriptional regulator/antitoxin component of YhaV-PrlF toxin-antitoxin module